MTRSFSFLWVIALFVQLTFQSCSPNIDTNKVKHSNPAPDAFIKNWMVLGPLPVSEQDNPGDEEQFSSFETNQVPVVNTIPESILKSLSLKGEKYKWKYHESLTDIIDLTTIYGDKNFVTAYAYATIDYNEAKVVLTGIGSDDAIKVWLNGKEVHKKYTGRPVTPDEDLLELNFNKGTNHILVKIQNMSGDWGFCIRPIGSENVSQKLFEAAGRGNIDDINLLLQYKADVNYQSPEGLTIIQNAIVKGRLEVVDLLKEIGAVEGTDLPDVNDYLNAKIEESLVEETPAIAVLVSENGKIVYKNAFGYANIENKTKATITTKFRIGSITKQFIATAILKLQEESKLSVNDNLAQFIPDFPRGNEVTIHHLLTHTSGIQSFTGRFDFVDRVTEPVEAKNLVDSMKTWEFDFNPGDEFRYNNSGYFLLAEIIEVVSGQWYGDYLQDNIFVPLGMKNSGVYQNNAPPENEAIGYTVEDGKYIPSMNWDMSWAGGAGSLYSTIEDLYIWNEALFNGEVLSSKSMKDAHTIVTLNDGSSTGVMNYGYGWGINNMRGVEEIAHGGGLPGFISYLARYPDENLTVVALTNTLPTMEQLNPNQVANEIAEYILWEKMTPQECYSSDIKIAPEVLSDYVGRYDYGNSMIMVITVDEDRLFAQMSGQPKFEIFPSKEDEFFWKVVEAKITFMRDKSGTVTHGIHTQGGNDLEVPKMEEFKTIEISETEIEPYIGSYKLKEEFYLEISLDNNQLFMQATGQDKLEIFQVSKDTYKAKNINLEVRFYMHNDAATMDYTQGTFKKTMTKE